MISLWRLHGERKIKVERNRRQHIRTNRSLARVQVEMPVKGGE